MALGGETPGTNIGGAQGWVDLGEDEEAPPRLLGQNTVAQSLTTSRQEGSHHSFKKMKSQFKKKESKPREKKTTQQQK